MHVQTTEAQTNKMYKRLEFLEEKKVGNVGQQAGARAGNFG
jgi:tetrahydromethanopterin S-methyltransferase subunit G